MPISEYDISEATQNMRLRGFYAYTDKLESVKIVIYLWHQNDQNDFDISSQGRAEVLTNLRTRNATSVRVFVTLQKYDNNQWQTVKSWSQSSDQSSITLSKSYYVSKGYRCRMTLVCYVYQHGRMVESEDYVSGAVWY